MPKKCEYQTETGTRCTKNAMYNIKDLKPLYCGEHRKNGMVNVRSYKCVCGKSQPNFGYKDDKTPRYCNKCKLEGMIDIKSKKCFCGKKRPCYALKNENIPTHCRECKTDDMVNVINKMCVCGKHQPLYGFKDDKKATRCKECKLTNMIDIKSKKCKCRKFPSYGYKIATHCKNCSLPGMQYVRGNKCFCGKHSPSFGFNSDKTASRCKECKLDGMIDIKSKKCFCGKYQPLYGYKNDKRPTRCKECKLKNMIYIKGKKCICGKRPHFGYKNGSSTHCANCKLQNMINLSIRKCICGKYEANFGYKNDKRPTRCNECKLKNMINLKGIRCLCGTIPSFGYKNSKPICCSKCKNINMINLKNKKCSCGEKEPSFGFKDDKTASRCKDCKLDGMMNIVSKKCVCGKRPSFGFKNMQPTHCMKCKLPDMINLIKKTCKSNETHNNICLITGNKNYNGYCTHCFANLFPDHPKTQQIRMKSKELQVVSYISSKYDGFIHDKALYVDLEGGCCATRRRIDLRKLINNTLLCIEIDENQHKKYLKQDERNRYDDLFMDFSGKYIFIRYNPDIYKEGGKRKNPHFDTRMETLTREIDKHIQRIENGDNNDLLEIHHLYYNDIQVKII